MTAEGTDAHPSWCPLDHSLDSDDGSYERALCVLLEEEDWDEDPLVVWIMRDRTDSYVDPGTHVYLRVDGQISVAYYGYASEDISRLVALLLLIVDAMADYEETRIRSLAPRVTTVWDRAFVLEARSGISPREPQGPKQASAVHTEDGPGSRRSLPQRQPRMRRLRVYAWTSQTWKNLETLTRRKGSR